MITDARVLQSNFVPHDVKHRPAEISHLTDTLNPIVTGEGYPEASFLYGPSGAGKTCIARYTTEQLREEVVDISTQYVNSGKITAGSRRCIGFSTASTEPSTSTVERARFDLSLRVSVLVGGMNPST